MPTLLIELLTEELPPKALARLGEAFARGLFDKLSAQGLLDDDARVESFATPRRLAASITGARRAAPDRALREKVLPINVAFDAQGKPAAPLTKKLAALAQALGVARIAPESLERAPDGKTEALFHRHTARGVKLVDGLQAALSQTLASLPIPKAMTYQRPNGDSVQFARPAHRLIALLDHEMLPVSALGLQAGNVTQGHRFLTDGDLVIRDAASYASVLEIQGKVIASYARRREIIRAALLEAAGADTVVMPEALLDEVNALVEWPVVYACHFEAEFLAVPQACLILTMQTHQKYFALTDASGRLRNRFLVVSNLATDTPRAIIEGNERVVRPRLADARFFFEHDQQKPLAARVPQLAHVVYHNRIGTQLERTMRLVTIAKQLAGQLGANVEHAARGALLAKADLLTDMVGEFPELQGAMGACYARHDGEPEDVALACAEHYQPRFAGDTLPVTATGTLVALADKLETLVGIWGIGLAPTGEKDPFALRRHALGILRMLIEKPLALSLADLLETSAASFREIAAVKPDLAALSGFLYDRLRGYLKDKGWRANEVDAVVSQRPQRLDDLLARLEAVRAFAALPQAEALAAANKRIANLLKKTNAAIGAVQPQCLREPAEHALHDAIARSGPRVHDALARGDFTAALTTLATLREAVDAFFDTVMVMTDDATLRDNRLALLNRLRDLMNRVADLSRLAA